MYIEFHFEFNDWNSILHERKEQVIIVISMYNYLLFRLFYTKEITKYSWNGTTYMVFHTNKNKPFKIWLKHKKSCEKLKSFVLSELAFFSME